MTSKRVVKVKQDVAHSGLTVTRSSNCSLEWDWGQTVIMLPQWLKSGGFFLFTLAWPQTRNNEHLLILGKKHHSSSNSLKLGFFFEKRFTLVLVENISLFSQKHYTVICTGNETDPAAACEHCQYPGGWSPAPTKHLWSRSLTTYSHPQTPGSMALL